MVDLVMRINQTNGSQLGFYNGVPIGITQLPITGSSTGPTNPAIAAGGARPKMPFDFVPQNYLNEATVQATYARFRSSVDLNGLQRFAGIDGYFLLSNTVNQFWVETNGFGTNLLGYQHPGFGIYFGINNGAGKGSYVGNISPTPIEYLHAGFEPGTQRTGPAIAGREMQFVRY